MRQKNIHRTHLNTFIDYALIRGVSADYLLSGISNPKDDKVTEEEFWEVLTLIQAKLPDGLLGIYTGRAMCVSALGLIYELSMQCTTIGEALFYLQSYIIATLPIVALDVRETSGQVHILLSPAGERSIAYDLLCGALLIIIEKELRLMCKGAVKINCFSPDYGPDYPDNWSYGNTYGLIAGEITLKASLYRHLNWKLGTLVPGYLKLIENIRQERPNFVSQVKVMALSMSTPKLPTMLQVAANFNLTPRSFQRKLASEDSSYRQVVDGLNRNISFFLSQHKTYRVSDIAAILGYSEPTAYIRAKKRWQMSVNDKL